MRLLFIIRRPSPGGTSPGCFRVCSYIRANRASARTRINRGVELQIVRRSRRLRGEGGGEETSAEREEGEQSKADETFASLSREKPPPVFPLRSLSLSLSASRVVALAVAYRYGYSIRRTRPRTNGYFAETASRRAAPYGKLLRRRAEGAIITNGEGGKSRSNFPLRKPKRLSRDPLIAAAVAAKKYIDVEVIFISALRIYKNTIYFFVEKKFLLTQTARLGIRV